MNETAQPIPRVTQIEIHYDDGTKDVIRTASKERTKIPLFICACSTPDSTFSGAYTNYAIAGMLFQTALSRQLVRPGRDKNAGVLVRAFGHFWSDPDYPPASTPPSK